MAQAWSVLQKYGSLGLGAERNPRSFRRILLAPLSLVHPELGWLSIKAFAAAVLFGFGNVSGAVLVACCLESRNNFLRLGFRISQEI